MNIKISKSETNNDVSNHKTKKKIHNKPTKQDIINGLKTFVIGITVFAIILVLINMFFPKLDDKVFVWYYNLTRPYTPKESYLDNAAYKQGQNDYYALGTCGPTSLANTLNIITNTSDYSENDVLRIAMENDLCVKDENPMVNGATTQEELVQIIDILNTDGSFLINVYNDENVPDVNEFSDIIDDPKTAAIVSVDSVALSHEKKEDRKYKDDTVYTDHVITVYETIRDKSDNVTGFRIVDSGFGIDEVSLDQFISMYKGDTEHPIDSNMIIITCKN